jgi:arylsulfatase A-like enzyme
MEAIFKPLSGLSCLMMIAGCNSPGNQESRPNIILIMADDIGIEAFGCYGGSSYETPNIDLMAKEGKRFTHAYSQPLCAPTRLQLMTGKYNHRNWIAFGIIDPAERTFGHFMRDAGYRTCIAGKWQLYSYDPPEFPGADERRGKGMHPDQSGFEEYMLWHALHTEDKGSRYANPTYLHNGVLHKNVEGAYGEDLNLEFINSFLEKHRDEPMFIYYPMSLTHLPFTPTPISESWSNPEMRLRGGMQNFPDMVKYMDMLVGKLIAKVRELGLAENTLILFYADNGTFNQIYSKMGDLVVQGGKAQIPTTQSGIRVPLIAWWPGTVDPGISDDLIDASDFLPTMAELAEKDIPGDWHTDGISFAPVLKNEPRELKEAAFFWYDPRPGWDKEKFSGEIFALDHHFKLFSNGRMYEISGVLPIETELDTSQLSPAAVDARNMLRRVMEEKMKPVGAGR